jgi:hypothetical protein
VLALDLDDGRLKTRCRANFFLLLPKCRAWMTLVGSVVAGWSVSWVGGEGEGGEAREEKREGTRIVKSC